MRAVLYTSFELSKLQRKDYRAILAALSYALLTSTPGGTLSYF